MSRLYVYQKIAKLVRRHGTRDPFELLDAMHVQVRFYYDLTRTKGFSRYFLRQYFVGINGNLPESEQRVVAAHELGHIVLHAQELRSAPLFDTAVYDKRSATEYEANLFAAEISLPDDVILDYIYQGYDAEFIAAAMDSDINLVALKVEELKHRGHNFYSLEHSNKFLK